MTDPRQGLAHDDVGESGFTLVELLVALTLFSLLSLLLISGLRFGVKAWERGLTHSERLQETLLAQSLLRQFLGQSYPLYLPGDRFSGSVTFKGTGKAVDFIAPAPLAFGSGGRFQFSVVVERRDERTDLIVEARPELMDHADSQTSTRTVLMSNIADADFAYFGSRRSERAPVWRSEWTNEMTLPQLVRVNVRLPNTDPRLWPELTIATRVSVDVACVYDVLTRRCRGR